MDVRAIPIEQLKPAPYNPRRDLQPTDAEYRKLAKSIAAFGLVEPLVWNEKSGNLVGGHQRLKVLEDMGAELVTVVVVQLDPAEEKACNLALNKISGQWHIPRLKDVLAEIDTGAFDIEVSGFELPEIEALMTALPYEANDGGRDGEMFTCPRCGAQVVR